MGWFEDLFKSPKQKREEAKGDTDYTKVSTLTGQQEDISGMLYDYLKGSIGKGLPAMETPEWYKTGIGRYQDILEGMTPEASAAYYQEHFAPLAKQQFEQDILPGIRESYVGTGFWGEPRARGQAGAWGRFGAEELSRQGQFFQGQQQLGLSALGMLPGMMGEAQGRYLQTLPEYNPALSQAMAYLGEPMFSIIQPPGTTTIKEEGGFNPADYLSLLAFL